jgi:predicted Zn-dependent protease
MSNSSFSIIILILILLTTSVFGDQEQPVTLTTEELKEKANKVLMLDNVSARTEIGVVFELVDRLIKEGRLKDAEKYVAKGLEHFPWNLQYQMTYAEILEKNGLHAKAKEKAELVFEYAETDELIDKSSKLINTYSETQFPEIFAIEKPESSLVLVPFGDCDKWLLVRIKADLAEILGIAVHIQTVNIRPPAANRDMRQRIIERYRAILIEQIADPQVTHNMKILALDQAALSEDKNVLILMRNMMSTAPLDVRKEFENELKQAAGKNKQWDADKLHGLLSKAVKPFRRKKVGYLGVTPLDIYSKDYNFLFGWAGRSVGIMSYHRFKADFNAETPNKERLAKRTLKQCLSSAGWIFGIQRCTIPTCARAYPHSLTEHDAKDVQLCTACSDGFKKVFRSNEK